MLTPEEILDVMPRCNNDLSMIHESDVLKGMEIMDSQLKSVLMPTWIPCSMLMPENQGSFLVRVPGMGFISSFECVRLPDHPPIYRNDIYGFTTLPGAQWLELTHHYYEGI